jgi:hypothetical protein
MPITYLPSTPTYNFTTYLPTNLPKCTTCLYLIPIYLLLFTYPPTYNLPMY